MTNMWLVMFWQFWLP